MEDWSLQAIVRQSSGADEYLNKIVDMNNLDDDQMMLREFSSVDDEFVSSFPDFFRDELEDLYKPFYPVSQENNIVDQEATANDGSNSVAKVNHQVYTPKYKRRKNQQKRVMIQVSADGLGSDMWGWRKYGQKPIKGSPNPRSYYRCSSSKGCLARKQVEQSCTDPGMFIITYTAEHNHSQPTRRNSLAGTIRQKFPNPKQTTFIQSSSGHPNGTMKFMEEDHIFPSSMGDSCNDDDYNKFAVSNHVFNDELFSGLDILDELLTE